MINVGLANVDIVSSSPRRDSRMVGSFRICGPCAPCILVSASGQLTRVFQIIREAVIGLEKVICNAKK